ncbi:MAG: hypothetical protein V4675_03620 [Verrucomicrobiota bacterium]
MKEATVSRPWTCDSCSNPIESIEDGWIEGLNREAGGRMVGHGLRLVHFGGNQQRHEARCQYVDLKSARTASHISDSALRDFVGPKGLMNLLQLIAADRISQLEGFEMIERLHIPGYEEARPDARSKPQGQAKLPQAGETNS